ncbi:MAG: DUF1156 domain-containing protein, partial [Planctomycetes bacterium]|nr:DUF1156 domain-containing protein [Planctomycetota bacterium]
PDPADELWPEAFREAAVEQIKQFANRVFPKKITAEGRLLSSEKHLSQESRGRWEAIAAETLTLDANEPADLPILRLCLLDFIADFANWDNSTVPAYLETSRALTQAAHEALGGAPGTRPLVVDPFAGGGSIPLEALRVGADAFASDLNPVAVLLCKVVLEYIPKYGQRLADEVRKWGQWVKEQAEKELAEFYPKDPDGATPIAYLWARTILSEAPGQGDAPVEVPLMRTMWLAKRTSPKTAMRWCRNASGEVKTERVEILYGDGSKHVVRRPIIEIFSPERDSEVENGTVARGSANCPVSGYTTPAANVREQFQKRRGGAHDSRLLVVVRKYDGRTGRDYRLPEASDEELVQLAGFQIQSRFGELIDGINWLPDETLPYLRSIFNINLLGVSSWGDLFTPRQALAHVTFARTIRNADFGGDAALAHVIRTLLTLALGKQTDLGNSLCRWEPIAQCPRQLFGRQAIGIVWDYAEGVPIGDSSGSWNVLIDGIARALDGIGSDWPPGQVQQADAAKHPLPDESASLLFTDPPYYDAIPYADLSDFFFVWQKRALGISASSLSEDNLTPKRDEIVQLAERNKKYAHKTRDNFEQRMTEALSRGREETTHDGIGVFVFAHKGTDAWEAMLQAVIDAGWTATASWPIDTEMSNRTRGIDSAALATSLWIVCRKRPANARAGHYGKVKREMQERITERLRYFWDAGIQGPDFVWAAIGPALESYSSYTEVRRMGGQPFTVSEFLTEVRRMVTDFALGQILHGASTEALDEWTRYYLMHANYFGAGDAPVGECILMAQGYGLPLDELSANRIGILKKASSGSALRLLGHTDRGSDRVGGPHASGGLPMIDMLHKIMNLWKAGDSEPVNAYLTEHGLRENDLFKSVVQALIEISPQGSGERSLLETLINYDPGQSPTAGETKMKFL